VISYLSRRIVVSAIGVCLSMLATTAPAQSSQRPYQMTILGSTNLDGFYTNAGADIPVFNRGHYAYNLQPAGKSILWTATDADLDAVDANDYDLIDWSRIVAVYVDEPYGVLLKNTSACSSSPTNPTRIAIDDIDENLSRVANAVRRKAPHARFWVNFTKHEIELILSPTANCDLNKPYIDVISMDVYGEPFYPVLNERSISELYGDLYFNHRHSPYQQLALVPGTFTSSKQSGQNAADWMSGYLVYAYYMNQECNLPLGPTRITGIYDRCPVWMIAGWMGGTRVLTEGSMNYYPIDHANSAWVFNAWQSAFAVPKVDPFKVRAARDLVPLLSDE